MYDDSTEQVKSLDESSAEEQFYGNSFRESTEEDLIAKAEKDKVQREQKLSDLDAALSMAKKVNETGIERKTSNQNELENIDEVISQYESSMQEILKPELKKTREFMEAEALEQEKLRQKSKPLLYRMAAGIGKMFNKKYSEQDLIPEVSEVEVLDRCLEGLLKSSEQDMKEIKRKSNMYEQNYKELDQEYKDLTKQVRETHLVYRDLDLKKEALGEQITQNKQEKMQLRDKQEKEGLSSEDSVKLQDLGCRIENDEKTMDQVSEHHQELERNLYKLQRARKKKEKRLNEYSANMTLIDNAYDKIEDRHDYLKQCIEDKSQKDGLLELVRKCSSHLKGGREKIFKETKDTMTDVHQRLYKIVDGEQEDSSYNWMNQVENVQSQQQRKYADTIAELDREFY